MKLVGDQYDLSTFDFYTGKSYGLIRKKSKRGGGELRDISMSLSWVNETESETETSEEAEQLKEEYALDLTEEKPTSFFNFTSSSSGPSKLKKFLLEDQEENASVKGQKSFDMEHFINCRIQEEDYILQG